MNKITHPLIAQIVFMSEPQSFTRKNKPDFTKIVVTLITSDNQKLYCEIRNRNIRLLHDINKGDIVDLEYIFAGSEKNGKQYNNIYIVNIEKS